MFRYSMIFMMSYTNNKYLTQLPKVHFQAENLLRELEEHFRAMTTTLNLRNILSWAYQTLSSRRVGRLQWGSVLSSDSSVWLLPRDVPVFAFVLLCGKGGIKHHSLVTGFASDWLAMQGIWTGSRKNWESRPQLWLRGCPAGLIEPLWLAVQTPQQSGT